MPRHRPLRPPPERQALLLLQSALALARDAVLRQHPRLTYEPIEDNPGLPASEVLAELLVDQCVELEARVQRYNTVIDHVLEPDDVPF